MIEAAPSPFPQRAAPATVGIIGVDLGGSHVRVGAMFGDALSDVHVQYEVTDRRQPVVLDLITHAIREVVAAVHERDAACHIEAVGIGVPGNVDPASGAARYLPDFDWGASVPLCDLVNAQLGIPIVALNDGRCAALAESHGGVGRGVDVFAFLTLGTGIGGALVVDGNLFEGASSDAGDFGHHRVRELGFDCSCGGKGCFGAHASATGLQNHYRSITGERIAARTITERFCSNESAACSAVRAWQGDLAQGLAHLVTFYNPRVIGIGGGLSNVAPLFEGLQALVDARGLRATRGVAEIVRCELGDDAGVIGAALYARSRLPAYKTRGAAFIAG